MFGDKAELHPIGGYQEVWVMMSRHEWMPALAISALALSVPAWAQDDQAAELAKKLANPVASLISVPLQYNYDEYGGANDGATVSKLVIQPVSRSR